MSGDAVPTSSPAQGGEHDWFQFKNFTCCRKCGIVQRRDGQNKLCKGIVHVELREDERNAFDDAWSAMQHSEDMAIKSIRRKLSVHELRSFLLLTVRMASQSRRSTPDTGEREAIKWAFCADAGGAGPGKCGVDCECDRLADVAARALLSSPRGERERTLDEVLSKLPGGNICDPQEIADMIRALKSPSQEQG